MGTSTHNSPFRSIFLLFLLLSFSSHSQFHHGLDLGINLTSADLIFEESLESGSALGFSIGYVAERDFSENLYLRFGVNYVQRTFNAEGLRGFVEIDEKWGVDGIEIPINMGYYLNWNNRNYQFFLDAGLNLGYNTRAFIQSEEETIRLEMGSDGEISRTAIGANIGAGLLIKSKLKVRLNYYNGFTNLANAEENTWKNRTFSLSLNYFLKEKFDD
jgi:hypothetical protein